MYIVQMCIVYSEYILYEMMSLHLNVFVYINVYAVAIKFIYVGPLHDFIYFDSMMINALWLVANEQCTYIPYTHRKSVRVRFILSLSLFLSF